MTGSHLCRYYWRTFGEAGWQKQRRWLKASRPRLGKAEESYWGVDYGEVEMRAVAVIGLALPRPNHALFARLKFAKRVYGFDSHVVISLLPAVMQAVQVAGRVA